MGTTVGIHSLMSDKAPASYRGLRRDPLLLTSLASSLLQHQAHGSVHRGQARHLLSAQWPDVPGLKVNGSSRWGVTKRGVYRRPIKGL